MKRYFEQATELLAMACIIVLFISWWVVLP